MLPRAPLIGQLDFADASLFNHDFLPPLESFADEGDLPVNGPDDLPAAAKRFANRIDQHLAERAYVAESAITYVKQNRPDWLQSSTVVVGSSAGALALPAVVARIGPVDSAVLIAGGANIPEAMLRSSLRLANPFMQDKKRGATKSNTRPLTEIELARFEAIAFEYMKFDPANLAPVLDGTPTLLLLLGTLDSIVPAENGLLLYEKFQKPELWKYPVGHNLLMTYLPTHAERIKSWISAQCVAETFPSPIPYQKRKRTRVQIEDNTAPKKNDRLLYI